MKTLLVHGGSPALHALLAEQLEGWQIRTGPAQDKDVPPSAALLATGIDHSRLAAQLRGSGMIGPLLSVGEVSAPAPMVGLARPFRISTLRQHLENPRNSWVDGTTIGSWRLDMVQKGLVEAGSGRLERLTDKELALLRLILLSLPAPVDRETLQTEIWRYHADADTHTVETHVWRLRQKLEADPGTPELLVTVPEGYTLRLL